MISTNNYIIADKNPNPVVKLCGETSKLLYQNKASEIAFGKNFNPIQNIQFNNGLLNLENNSEFEVNHNENNFLVKVSIDKIDRFIYLFITDITQLKKQFQQAQESIRKQQKVTNQILDSLPINIFLKDENKKFLFVNKQTASSLNLEIEEFIGKTDLDVHPENIANKLQDDDDQVWQSNELIIKEEEITRGSERFHLLSGKKIIEDEINNTKMLLGFSLDITEKKIQEDKLKYQQEFIQAVIDGSPNLIFVKDYEGNFLMINEAVADLFGSSKETVINQNNAAVHDHPEEVEAYSKIDRQVISEMKTIDLEEPFSLPNGETKWFYTIKKPLVRPDGTVHALAISIDITDRKKFEEELKVAKENAEEASLAKTNFLSNMSHEIRTPLNAILGMTSLLEKSIPGKKEKSYLSAVKKSGENLLNIINEILDFAKIDAGKMTIDKSPIDVNEIINNVLISMRPKAEEKDLLITSKTDVKIKNHLIGDPLRLTQILMNLLSNSLKFTEKGSVMVSSNLINDEPNKQTIRFMIKDSGIGIAEEMQQKVFESFTQEDSSITRRFGGSGLGLPICKSLVELQGGEIWLQSKKGKGTTFYFDLSFEVGKSQESKSKTIQKDFTPLLENKKILIAEDNLINQFLIKSILEQWKVNFEIANNGKEVIEKLKSNNFDAVLMDIQMPVMDGTEATHIIRTTFEESKRNIPILALTANALNGNKEHYLNVGMNDYIAKPFDTNDLGTKITNIITK